MELFRSMPAFVFRYGPDGRFRERQIPENALSQRGMAAARIGLESPAERARRDLIQLSAESAGDDGAAGYENREYRLEFCDDLGT